MVGRIALAAALALGLEQEPRDAPAHQAPSALSWHVPGEGRGRPALDGTLVFFLTAANDVVAVDARRGHVRWRAPIGPRASADLVTLGPHLAVAGPVVVGGGFTLVALDRVTGTKRWEFAPPLDHGLGFYLGESFDDVVFAGSSSGALFAVEARTGSPRWRKQVSGPRTTVYAPTVSGSEVAVAFRNFDVREDSGLLVVDRETGVGRWRRRLPPSPDHPAGTPPAGGPVADEESWFVSGHDGAVHALSRATGQWRWSSAPSPHPDFRPVVVASRAVVAGSLSGEVTAYDRLTGAELWRVKPAWASVAFELTAAGDVVYVPCLSGETFGLSILDGREVWRTAGRGFRYAPRAAANRLYLASAVSGFFSVDAGL